MDLFSALAYLKYYSISCLMGQLFSVTTLQMFSVTAVQRYSCSVLQLFSVTAVRCYSCSALQLFSVKIYSASSVPQSTRNLPITLHDC